MNKTIQSFKSTYVFILLAFILLVGAIFIQHKIDETRYIIKNINNKSNIEHVITLSQNIANKIVNETGQDIYNSLELDDNLRIKLEEDLQYFVTQKYKDIYLLDKKNMNKKDFRVLLDATKNIDDKFAFQELYRPVNLDKYNKAYATKKPIHFENKDIQSLWMTCIYPIVINNNVQAILVVDFSIKELNIINSTLYELDDIFEVALLFFVLVFFIIVYFSYTDFKRERLKRKVFEALKLKTDELEIESSKLKEAVEIKSNFLANMSHEIRTPLNGILGFVDILKDNIKEKENKKYLKIINNSSHHLLGVIDDILDFSKIENGKLSIEFIDFNIKKELQSIVDLFMVRANDNNISIEVNFDNDLPHVLVGDVLRIKQVLSNLLSNAIKFTPQGKKIYLSIKYIKNLLYVNVKDEGIGISQNRIAHIFEAFAQEDNSTTRKYGGTGLGLTISYNLVKAMSGELKLKSELGLGSEFYFSIPLKVSTQNIKTISKKSINILEGEILVVEDNKSNQMFMKVILKNMGLKFDIAQDGQEAVNMFNKNKYDAILMDENMPNMNGIEATKQIINIEQSRQLPHTPIVALTANALKGDRERFLAAGMDEYLAKPIDKKKLNKILSKYLKSPN